MAAQDFKKPALAASVAVYCVPDATFLMILRKHEPFANKLAFPGGYMDVDREDIYGTAVRELREETGFVANRSGLQLLDIRSAPTRDPRGHVIDVGFLFVTNAQGIERASEESEPRWVPWQALGSTELAFDHREMFDAARFKLGLG